ncbi:hypothetical protein EVAR_58791_1 [Eumeta japonica]|uniref:Uncharacterized protein n=1 Tax=Eumeta variegata TaxID=151549 RepID=A0A4C1YKC0_EUMVA|nr:hypothetical protein EVAR_58791_1 [Eumeta japonica]
MTSVSTSPAPRPPAILYATYPTGVTLVIHYNRIKLRNKQRYNDDKYTVTHRKETTSGARCSQHGAADATGPDYYIRGDADD